jgi:hypothetical protein
MFRCRRAAGGAQGVKRMTRSTAACLLLGILLAGCADAGGRWTKAGANQEAASSDYEDCRSEARAATERDAAIDADIMASRGADWQRAGTLGVQQDAMAAHTKTHARDIINRCMASKGYKPAP